MKTQMLAFCLLVILAQELVAAEIGFVASDIESIRISSLDWGTEVLSHRPSAEDVVAAASTQFEITDLAPASAVLDLLLAQPWTKQPDSGEDWPIIFVMDVQTSQETIRFVSDGCSLKQLRDGIVRPITTEFRRAFAFGSDNFTRTCNK